MDCEEDEHLENLPGFQVGVGERLEFTSVGIDIGSSTTHLMFSRLTLARRGREYFSGYSVIGREVVYRSPVILTPFVQDNARVDAARIRAFIEVAYAEAGLAPDRIDTGAVVTTGEAAKKENTAAIVDLLAQDAGKFVCAAAGPNMEAVMAAHGSGAVKHSHRHKEGGHETILNVDIGGGTSKLALVEGGRVLETGAINVGSRLIAWDAEGRITRIEEAGARVAASLGIPLEIGGRLESRAKRALAQRLSELLFEVIEGRELSGLARSLMITPEISHRATVDLVVYSGGVAEFIYGEEGRDFGDLGPWIGDSIRRRQERWGVATGVPAERIRATVIGASQYTVQVSGNTIFLSDPELLPLHNLPVVNLPRFSDPVTRGEVAGVLEKSLRLADLAEGEDRVAIAVSWDQDPDCRRVQEFAEGLRTALPRSLGTGAPVVVVFDNDVGQLIGHALSRQGFRRLVTVDNINIGRLSYVDIGQQLATANAVPVTVKSLVFC